MATVFVVQGKLRDWQMWRQVTGCPTKARSKLRILMATYEPTLIACEDPDQGCRKRGKSLKLLRTLVQAVADEPIRHAKLPRPRHYRTRYEEAEALSRRFPEISPWCPKPRKSYENDAKNLTYFEALAYAAAVLDTMERSRSES